MTAQLQEAPVDESHETSLEADGSLTLSDQVLAEAHLRSGDKIVVQVIAEGVIRLVRRPTLLDLAGAFPGISVAADLEGLREEWDR